MATVRASRRNSRLGTTTDENECFKLKIMPLASSVLTSYERNTTFSDRALNFPSLFYGRPVSRSRAPGRPEAEALVGVSGRSLIFMAVT